MSLAVEAGEVHGLLGENGSGKSTLIRILAGYHAPSNGGELEVRGQHVKLPLRPGEPRGLGFSFVHEDLGLIPSLGVVENLRLVELSTERRLRLSWRAERRRAAATLARYGVVIDVRARVADLAPMERAQLAIVRAVESLPDAGGLLVLDETTAFLPEDRRRRLVELVRRIAGRGAGVLFVSHDIGEAREVTDRITVLRDGRNAGTVTTAGATTEGLVELILGHRLTTAERTPAARGDAAISVIGLSGAIARGISFEAGRGEVLGLTGLAGSGFEEIPYLLFGALPAYGRLRLNGTEHELPGMTPGRALRAGLALVPSDRQRDGSVGSLSVAENVTLPSLGRYRERIRLARRRMLADVAQLLDEYDVRPRRPRLPYRALSGGNQQKAQLAKWLHLRPSLLLLDEPTRGVDVGAREQIAATIRRIAREGTSVVCASGDYEQHAHLCDRLLVLAAGAVVAELKGAAVTREGIASACHTAARDPRDAG